MFHQRLSAFIRGQLQFLGVILFFIVIYFSTSAFAQSPLSGFNPASLTGRSDGAFIDGTAFTGDNAIPLQAVFLDKWDGPSNPDDRNNLDGYWKTEAGFIYHGIRFSGFYRGEFFAETNKDTLEILRMANLEQELPVGRDFKIDLKGKGFSANGVEISKGFGLERIMKGLSAGFTARYMIGDKIQEGNIKGNVIATGPTTYDFDLSLDYVYDENLIYKRKYTVPGYGEGYSYDLGLKYTFKERFSAEVLFRDMWGRLHWKDVPYTIADATSDVKSFDEEGYQVYRPTIRGYEGYRDFTQKIPQKTDIIISYTDGPFTITPTVNLIEHRPLYWLDLRYKATENTSFSAGYNTNYRAFSVGASYGKASLNLYSSDTDLNRAGAVGLKLSLQYEW